MGPGDGLNQLLYFSVSTLVGRQGAGNRVFLQRFAGRDGLGIVPIGTPRKGKGNMATLSMGAHHALGGIRVAGDGRHRHNRGEGS